MNSLKYIFIGVVISIISFSCLSQSNKIEKQQTITLQSLNADAPKDQLSESSRIITNRLKCLNVTNFTVEQNDEKSQLIITFNDKVDSLLVETISSQGKLRFLEGYNKEALAKLASSGCLNRVDSLLGLSEKSSNYPNAAIGQAQPKDTSRISSILSSCLVRSLIPNNLSFLWGKYPTESGKIELYIVSSEDTGINETSLQSACVLREGQNTSISITFKEDYWSKWEALTKKNMGKPIAFVIDNRVFCAPIVKSIISGGNAEITGNYSEIEANRLATIISCGRLPLDFQIK